MRLISDLLDRTASEGSLETEEDVNRSDVADDWEFTICQGQNENAVEVSEGLIKAYPDVMSSEAKRKFQEVVRSEKESEGSIERLDIEDEVTSLKEMDKNEIDSVFNHFKSMISYRHGNLLKICLYLQHAKKSDGLELNKPIQEYKGDLRDDFGTVAIYMNHLVSSGYFNEGGYFRTMYRELSRRNGDPDQRYRDEFELIIEHELIALYVNDEDTSRDVMHGIRGLLNDYFRYSPYQSFTDVRGIGEDCEEVIKEGLEMVEEDYENLLTRELESDDETAIRLLPESMSRFSNR
ncbi:hypothetical protein HTG_08305 [Natrinema mahii]|nr:hypothetical protein HTG_08305 [Natrinema mahii]